MDAAARAAGIARQIDSTAEASRDVESAISMYRSSRNTSRVSLPDHRKRSMSIHNQRAIIPPGTALTTNHPHVDGGTSEEAADGSQEDFAWGPSHPCFPHPNPHVPRQSPEHHSTKIIRIQRDWMVVGDTAPTFSLVYPEILDMVLSENDFRQLITHVNDELIHIYDPWRPRAWLDAFLDLATGWLWGDFGMTAAKKEFERLESWIENWSNQHGRGQQSGLFRVIPLRRTAFLSLDIQIPDPEIE